MTRTYPCRRKMPMEVATREVSVLADGSTRKRGTKRKAGKTSKLGPGSTMTRTLPCTKKMPMTTLEVATREESVLVDGEILSTKKRGTKRKAGKTSKLPSPQLKKAKTSVSYLATMPLDIIYEIFSHLGVEDLMHLSKIRNTSLYALLTDPSSKLLWRAARAKFVPPMPACPDDMKDHEFASLLLSPACQYCGNTDANYVKRAWYARRVICFSCIEEHCSTKPMNTPFFLRKLFARKGRGWSKSTVCFDDYMPHIAALFPRKQWSETYYFIEYYNIWEAKVLAMETVDERWQWLEKKKTIEDAKDFFVLCSSWYEDHLKHQEIEHNFRINSRKARVVKYAKTIGWSEEIDKNVSSEDKICSLPGVVKACQTDLTEGSLLELKPLIDAHMQGTKNNRLERERKGLIEKRLPILQQAFATYKSNFTFTQRLSFVSTAELFLEPRIQDIIFNVAHSDMLTEEHFLPTIIEIAPDANRRLRVQIEKQLFELVQDVHLADRDESTVDCLTALSLATTVFYCSKCRSQLFLSVEQAIMHPCTRDRCFPQNYRDRDIIRLHLGSEFRSHRDLTFFSNCADAISQLVKVCGLDPITTTKQQMDELDPIFECVKCYRHASAGRAMGSWATMANHYADVHSPQMYRNSFEPERLIGEEEAVVRTRIAEQTARVLNRYESCMLACAHCGNAYSSREDLESHIKQIHHKHELTVDDFIPNPSKVHTPATYYLWPPRSEDIHTVVVSFEK